MKINLKITVIVLLFLTNSIIISQRPNYRFKSIVQSDGLINSTIMTMFEDSFGFIWIGTQQGIQRFDGKTFKSYQASYNDSLGLSSNFIYGMGEDNEKNIWICTAHGLNKYNRSNDKIVRYKLGKEIVEKNKAEFFSSILPDAVNDENLWLAGNGVLKLNKNTGKSEFYKYGDVVSPNAFATYFYWIKQHPLDKDLLLMGSSDLVTFNKKTGEFKELISIEQDGTTNNNLILDLAVDPANNEILWMATGDNWGRGSLGSLIKYNIYSGRETIYNKENRPNELTELHLMKLCFYDNNKLWIGARNNGAFLYDKEKDKFYNYSKSKYDPESLVTSVAVISLLKDRSGAMWFGSWGDGISILTPTSQKFSHSKSTIKNNPQFISTDVLAFTEDEKGNIWIGTRDAGLSKYDPKENNYEQYFEDFFTSKNEPIQIFSLLYDSNNNLWIGTYNDALYRYDPRKNIRTHYKMGKSEKNVSQKRISTITEFNRGEILIATYGGGLNIYNYSTDSFKHYMNDPKDSTSIADNQIWGPFIDKKGNYYFSGNAFGYLIKFDPTTEKFKNISNLNISTFTAPVKNHSGNILINDVEQGLREIYLGDTIRIKTLYDNFGHSIDNVESILVDSEEKVWLGTGNGILEYDPELRTIKKYDVEDGLNGYQFNRLAAFKASTGAMYFGGTNGFTFFHPDEITLSKFEPHIAFVSFKLFQKDILIGENSVLKKNILMENLLELDHDQNDFSITYSALDFSEPQKIKYKHILEGHDGAWIDGGYNNTASYTNLDPGDYTLKVLATNSDGVWIKDPKEMRIIITPPIWKTTIAYIIYGIFFIAGVFVVDRVQRKRLLAKERISSQIKEAELRAQLAEKENERKTSELEEARKLQLSMLPRELPKLPNLDIAVYMKTATEVGGDYYDYHIHLDGTFTVVLGDATGHGMQSGMMVSIIKSLFMSDRRSKEIQPFFHNTNIALKDMNLGRLMMALTCVQLSNDNLKSVIAGMPPILFYNKNLDTSEEIVVNNMPLGAMKVSEYNVIEKKVSSGDTILLMSDGFAELQNEKNEMIGYQKTRNLFEDVAKHSSEQIIEKFKNYQAEWTNGKDPVDDVTFVVIKIK